MLQRLVRPSSTLPAVERTYAHAALGKICDDAGELARAFKHFSAAFAALKRARTPYDERAALDEIERTGEVARGGANGAPSAIHPPIASAGLRHRHAALGHYIDRADFLAIHPEVCGAGEIRDFALAAADLGGTAVAAGQPPRRRRADVGSGFRSAGGALCRASRRFLVRRQADRQQDSRQLPFRRPDRFSAAQCALRARAARSGRQFPASPVFSTQFATNLPYANDLAELGRYHRAYEALMAVWRARPAVRRNARSALRGRRR